MNETIIIALASSRVVEQGVEVNILRNENSAVVALRWAPSPMRIGGMKTGVRLVFEAFNIESLEQPANPPQVHPYLQHSH